MSCRRLAFKRDAGKTIVERLRVRLGANRCVSYIYLQIGKHNEFLDDDDPSEGGFAGFCEALAASVSRIRLQCLWPCCFLDDDGWPERSAPSGFIPLRKLEIPHVFACCCIRSKNSFRGCLVVTERELA